MRPLWISLGTLTAALLAGAAFWQKSKEEDRKPDYDFEACKLVESKDIRTGYNPFDTRSYLEVKIRQPYWECMTRVDQKDYLRLQVGKPYKIRLTLVERGPCEVKSVGEECAHEDEPPKTH
jgi:hypothetical protein